MYKSRWKWSIAAKMFSKCFSAYFLWTSLYSLRHAHSFDFHTNHTNRFTLDKSNATLYLNVKLKLSFG